MLKSDQQGFLIGEVLDVSKAMLKGQEQGLESLGRIESLLRRPGRLGAQRTRSIVIDALPAEPVGRRSPVLLNTSGAAIPLLSPSAASRSQAAPSGVGGVAARDDRGRFVKRDGTGSPAGKKGPGAEPRAPAPDEARSSSGENRIVEAIKETAANSTDRMDPMIEAAKEVWEPLGRGWRASFGQNAERKKERWYKRIWQALTRKKGDGQDQAVAAGSSSGLLSGIAAGITSRLAGLAGMIPAILARVFAPVAAAWAAWEVGQWIGGKINDWLVKSGLQDKLFAWVDGMRAGWSSMMDRLGKLWDDNIEKPAKKAAAAAVDVAERVYDGGVALINGASNTFADGASATNTWVQEKTGLDVASGIKRLLAVEGTKRVYELSDGSVETRQGGSVSWRNNNPGNLKFGYSGSADKSVNSRRSKAQALAAAQRLYEGVVDLDQFGNAIFSTPELGSAAKLKLLQRSHGEKTIEQMLPHYAVDDYSGKANHAAYANSIHKFAQSRGLDLRGKPIGSMSSTEIAAVAGAMKQFEGFKVGRSTAGPAATASVPGISVPSIRNMSLVKPIGSAPDVAFPPLSGNDVPSINLNLSDQVGQNVSDRSIAHITTGGLGGG